MKSPEKRIKLVDVIAAKIVKVVEEIEKQVKEELKELHKKKNSSVNGA